MIVDDEPSTIEVVRRHLQAVCYCDFVTTTDPAGVLKNVRQELPEILILDVKMDQHSGLEILESIRHDKQLCDLPVIILTAASDGETRKVATALGATDFLAKPVDSNELALRVRNVLSIKARQARIAENSQRFALRYVTRPGREVPVTIILLRNQMRQEFEGKLHDLATGGARLQVPVKVNVAQQLEIQIVIEEIDFFVSNAATARWVQETDENWEVGCEFAEDIPEHVFETMADAGYLERRCEQRWRISLDALLKQQLASEREVNVLLEDYSPGGIRLFSPQPINVGERLLLDVRDENYELCSIPARAMWQIDTDDGYTIGCAFLNKSGYASMVRVVVSTSQADGQAVKNQHRPGVMLLVWLGTLGILIWCLAQVGLLSWIWPF